jgi:hypothetical protein
MKKILIVAFVFCLTGGAKTFAQRLSRERRNVDINSLRVLNLVHGNMWVDDTAMSFALSNGFEFPRGSGRQASYTGGIWATARDANDSLYTSATLYSSIGFDFYPGTLNDTGFCTDINSEAWSKIWKINQSDILAFKALATRTLSTVPSEILEWPAKGNIYAKGGYGMPLSITEDMAPFVDVNSDGKYNALDGDYPLIKGDQMLWWVINDNTNNNPHTVSKGKPMRIEYRVSAYAYNRGSEVDRMIFYEYDMRNKSSVKLENFRFGFFSDGDIGNPYDDYVAFDSSHRMGICYNSKLPDGTGLSTEYGYHPPMVGYTLIEVPGDVYPGAMQPAGSFSVFKGSPTGPYRDPRKPIEFENYMSGKDADGNLPPGSPYRYSIAKGKEMCDSSVIPTDWRFLINSGGYAFQPRTSCKLAFAVVLTDTVGYACNTISTFDPVLKLADTAWKVYYNPPKPLSVSEFNRLDAQLRVFPNPAQNFVLLQSMTGRKLQAAYLQVYDMQGRKINVAVLQESDGLRIGLEGIASGAYHLIYEDADRRATASFVKQ